MNYNNALKIFNITPPLLPEDIRKTYKSLVFKNHPDKYPSFSDQEIEKQSKIMADINLAYELLQKCIEHGIYGDETHDSFDIFSYDFTDVVIGSKNRKEYQYRPKVHPDHKSEAYRELWHYIHKNQNKRHGLALRCLEKAIFILLRNLPAYPDIDGILHDYIRDCAGLLMRLGMFSKAFELVNVLVNSRACSYYACYPPEAVVWKIILNSIKHKNSIACWEKQFIGKVIFEDLRVSWAMLTSYDHSKEYSKAINNVESGAIYVPISKARKDITFDKHAVKSSLEREKNKLVKNINSLSCNNIRDAIINCLEDHIYYYRPTLKSHRYDSDLAHFKRSISDAFEFNRHDQSGIENAINYGFNIVLEAIPDIREERNVLDMMLIDVYTVLIKGLANTGFTSTSAHDLRVKYPKIYEILYLYGYNEINIKLAHRYKINLHNANTTFGLRIIAHPNLDYSEREVDAIWRRYSFRELLVKASKDKALS